MKCINLCFRLINDRADLKKQTDNTTCSVTRGLFKYLHINYQNFSSKTVHLYKNDRNKFVISADDLRICRKMAEKTQKY